MTEKNILKERIKFFLMGLLLAAGVIFLMGSKNDTVIDSGRYQLSAWGDSAAHGAFVMDTITGETKIVYRYKDVEGDKSKERNHLNTPFVKIK